MTLELKQALQDLDSDDPVVRADAIRTLVMRGQPDVVGPDVARMLDDRDELVRADAADAIGVLGYYRAALDAVRTRLREDDSPLVRAAAAETLGDLGDAAAIPELTTVLDDPDAAVRAFAANALGLIGSAELLPVLEQRLGVEPAATVRAELQGGRYRLGACDALPALLTILDQMDGDLGVNVLELWDDLTSRRMPPALALDAPAIVDALTRVGQRVPALQLHARRLIERLASPD